MLINRAIQSVCKHWLLLINVSLGIFVSLPWLAPVLMEEGFPQPANAIYFVYGFTCHQLPQRSYFLFGEKFMYSRAEIQAVWPVDNIFIERQFIGTREMGYKVAYSDRMVSLYTAIFIGSLLFGLVRRRLRPLRLKWFVLLGIVPLFIDGFSHLVNDVSGWGFRDNNAWLVRFIGTPLDPGFLIGDAVGSLNWWLRLVTGLLFGFTAVWLIFPYIERGLEKTLAIQDHDLRQLNSTISTGHSA
ncbi:MAG: DUF2085 domain-containing protein [Chloroflexi bacterium]|nr:DUF2085 domain-containing protein [Chloroflexota bacterium]